MIDLSDLTIEKAHEDLKGGKYTCRDLAEAYLKVIQEKNNELNVFIEVYDDVLTQADVADQKFKEGEATLLTGIPFAIKDNILFTGHQSSSGSNILKNYTASYDSDAIHRLKKQGAVILGRANMDDSAMGVSTETSLYGVTKNPHDNARVPGGSSGGSTAAIAANMALAALGSDTGGSCRQPAAFCGVVGFKPTYGSVSRSGLIALASSLDVIGPITKNITDAEIVFKAIANKDELDSTSIPAGFYKKKDIKKPIIGVPRHLITEGVDNSVLQNLEESIKKLSSAGYEIVNIELPYVKYTVPTYYIIVPAEASTNLARFDGVRYGLHKNGTNLKDDYLKTKGAGYGKEVKRRILIGTYVLSAGYFDAFYNKAKIVQKLIINDYNKAFEKVDLILTPTTTGPAFKIGEKFNDPVKMYLEDIFTAPANITGLPAVSLPSGFVSLEGKSLPLGIHFVAPHGREDLLFEVGKNFEKIR